MTPPLLNRRISRHPFISLTASSCSVVFQSLNLTLSLNRRCSSGLDHGFADSSLYIVRRAFGSGSDDAGPGLIQIHSCGRQIGESRYEWSSARSSPRRCVYRNDSAAEYGLSVNGPAQKMWKMRG